MVKRIKNVMEHLYDNRVVRFAREGRSYLVEEACDGTWFQAKLDFTGDVLSLRAHDGKWMDAAGNAWTLLYAKWRPLPNVSSPYLSKRPPTPEEAAALIGRLMTSGQLQDALSVLWLWENRHV